MTKNKIYNETMLVELFDGELPEVLSEEELKYYFEKMSSGDLVSRQKIIEHNMRLIKIVVKKFYNISYETKELISVGLIGLIKSVDTFNISKRIRFSTYATNCIQNEILMYLRKNKKHLNTCSLNELCCTDKEDYSFEYNDIMYDKNADFVTEYEKKEVYRIIKNVISELPEKNRKVIELHFGFFGYEPISQQEISFRLGFSQSYISKILKESLKKIKVELQKLQVIEIRDDFCKKTTLHKRN